MLTDERPIEVLVAECTLCGFQKIVGDEVLRSRFYPNLRHSTGLIGVVYGEVLECHFHFGIKERYLHNPRSATSLYIGYQHLELTHKNGATRRWCLRSFAVWCGLLAGTRIHAIGHIIGIDGYNRRIVTKFKSGIVNPRFSSIARQSATGLLYGEHHSLTVAVVFKRQLSLRVVGRNLHHISVTG